MLKYTIIAVLMGAVPAFLSYLNKKSNDPLFDLKDSFKMPKPYLYMGYLMSFIAIGVLIVPIIITKSTSFLDSIIWAIIISLFLFGIYIIELFLKHKIETVENGFIVFSTFGKQTQFKYSGIKSTEISFLTYFITVKDQSGNSAKIYFHLKNLTILLKQIQNKSGVDTLNIQKLLKI